MLAVSGMAPFEVTTVNGYQLGSAPRYFDFAAGNEVTRTSSEFGAGAEIERRSEARLHPEQRILYLFPDDTRLEGTDHMLVKHDQEGAMLLVLGMAVDQRLLDQRPEAPAGGRPPTSAWLGASPHSKGQPSARNRAQIRRFRPWRSLRCLTRSVQSPASSRRREISKTIAQ